jgi:LPPG:FO 2-phospho-L-lactate transferase
MNASAGSVVVLTGGVGGVKLVRGLVELARDESIVAIVNTGDDFTHLGLRICPDIDTLIYTLSGLADASRGWGRADETWNFMEALRQLGAEDWFALGDRDLALHVERTRKLRSFSLTEVTRLVAEQLGLTTQIVPMSDDPVETRVVTDEGELAFQHYFVRRRCEPRVRRIYFQNAQTARPSPGVIASLRDEDLRAILIAPSNPWLSIDPILSIPGMRDAIRAAGVPVVAVTPLPGGRAVKGPTAKIMSELGLVLDASSIVDHYGDLVTHWLLDTQDVVPATSARVVQDDTLMRESEDRMRVANRMLQLAELA